MTGNDLRRILKVGNDVCIDDPLISREVALRAIEAFEASGTMTHEQAALTKVLSAIQVEMLKNVCEQCMG